MNKKKYLLLIAFIIAIDQILKSFTHFKVRNYGASFDILENQTLVLIIFSSVALMVFLYLFFKTKENKLAMSFLIAGTSSNLIDRLLLGYIIDYIQLPYLFTFNIADLVNFLGIIILVKDLWRK